MTSLDDQHIMVMGGTSGIGLAAVHGLLNQGAYVVAVGLEPEVADARHAAELANLTKNFSNRLEIQFRDAIDASSAISVVDWVVAEWGKLDGLLHVAGGSGRRWGDGPLHELTDEGWAKTIELNLSSVAWSNRAAIRQLLKQESGGTIVNIGSVMADAPTGRGFSTHAYIAAKAGIVGLSRAAAAEYAKDNIRVNVIQPGLIETPMSKRAQQDPAILHYIKTKQPLDGGRMGRVDDIVDAAVYLLSPGSKFVTGQVLTIDGGWGVSEGQTK